MSSKSKTQLEFAHPNDTRRSFFGSWLMAYTVPGTSSLQVCSFGDRVPSSCAFHLPLNLFSCCFSETIWPKNITFLSAILSQHQNRPMQYCPSPFYSFSSPPRHPFLFLFLMHDWQILAYHASAHGSLSANGLPCICLIV